MYTIGQVFLQCSISQFPALDIMIKRLFLIWNVREISAVFTTMN